MSSIYNLCSKTQEGIAALFGQQENEGLVTDSTSSNTFCHRAAQIWEVASEKIGGLYPMLQAIPESLVKTYSLVTEHGPHIIHSLQNVWNMVFPTRQSSTIGLIAVSAATIYIASRIRNGIRSATIFTLGVASGVMGVYLCTTNAPTGTS